MGLLLAVAALGLGLSFPAQVAAAIRQLFAWASPTTIVIVAAVVALASLVALAVPASMRDLAPEWSGVAWQELGIRIDRAPWQLSVGLVSVAAGLGWYSLGRALAAPRIFADEIIYARAARGLAESGSLFGHGYGIVTPTVDAAAYLLTGNDVAAYRLIQAINVAVMASASFPAYLLARRVLSHRLALSVAALSVFLPWMVYARFVMTEAAFYPVFLVFVLALVRALEWPSAKRQLFLALALMLAFETRTQAVALAAAVVTAVPLHGLACRELRAKIRAFAPTWALYASAGALALSLAAAGIWRPLGAYSVVLDEGWHPRGLLLGAAANVTSLALGLGVLVAVAAPLGAAVLLRRRASTGGQATGAAAVACTLWLVITVAVLSVTPFGQGIVNERSLFFVTPLLLICAIAWVARDSPRTGLLTAAIAAGMVVLAIVMPSGAITTQAVDALSFKLWARIPRDGLSAATLIVAAIAIGSAVVVRLRSAWPLIVSLAVATVGVAAASDYRSDYPRALVERYDWVDAALPTGTRAAILWIGLDEGRCPPGTAPSQLGQLALYTEYFNSRIGPVGHLLADNSARGLATDSFDIRADGVVTSAGSPLTPAYVVTDARVGIAGSRVALLRARAVGVAGARQGSALALWRVTPPLRLTRPAQALAASAACAAFRAAYRTAASR